MLLIKKNSCQTIMKFVYSPVCSTLKSGVVQKFKMGYKVSSNVDSRPTHT